MEQKLNHLLSSIHALNIKMHNAHWFAKGSLFLTIHEKTEGYYNEMFGWVDELAELMIQKGFTPKYTLSQISSFTLINDATLQGLNQIEIIETIISDFEFMTKHLDELILDFEKDENIKEALLKFHNFFLKEKWILSSLLD